MARSVTRGGFRRQWDWRARAWVAFAGGSLALLVRLLYLTLRVELIDPHDVVGRRVRDGTRTIIGFWHESVMLVPLVIAKLGWPRRVTAMLSWHRDAEIAGRALSAVGVDVARGSSTRGWLGSLRGLLAAHADGRDLAVVPDGPRGPRREAKDGTVQLARATGLPMVAVGAAAWPARRLRSWDRLQVPRPFARVVIVFSEPLFVARDADEKTRAAAHQHYVEMLTTVTEQACVAAGAPLE